MFKDRCCPDSAVNEGPERSQQIDQQTVLNTPQRSKPEGRSPFTLTRLLKTMMLLSTSITNFKVLLDNSETDTIFPQPTLPKDKNLGNYLKLSLECFWSF